jgi:LuxR family maltose regulon positive regulatory protein
MDDKDFLDLKYTKLNRPTIASNHLHRQRLLDRLDQQRYRPLTLVSAPAGYGKTTLVSCWLEACDSPSGWVSLDRGDNDLRTFVSYFIAAVESMVPGACRKTQTLIKAPDLPPMVNLASVLLNELDLIEPPCIMALDDYYLIEETMVHDLLTEILKHPPQSLHLVIATRHDPPLPIFRYRAAGQISEIRARDLSFSKAEAKVFLQNLLAKPVDDTMVAALNKKSEGWVTGLRLAALAMRHKADTNDTLLRPQTDVKYVMEYLFHEVFAQQRPEFREYLLYSAILDRFCGPLCDAVSGPDTSPGRDRMDGWEFIAKMNRENIFLVGLDRKHLWFRYHHLFRSFLTHQLQRHLSAGEISALHSRASGWLAENGLIDEAIQHALAAGDAIGAARLVEQHRQAMLTTDRWYVLEKWLSMLPETVIQQRPELLLAQVWIHYFHFRLTRIPSVLEVAESLLSNKAKEQPLYGEVCLFKGVLCFLQADGAPSLKFIEDAMDRIPSNYHMIRGVAEAYFGFAGQMQGQKEMVLNELSHLLYHQPLNDIRKVRVMLSCVCINIVSGDLTVADTLNQQLRKFVISIESTTNFALSLYFQGVIHYCRNELDMAIDYLGQAAELIHIVPRIISVDCQAGLALAYQVMQQTEKASATLERLFEYIHFLNDAAFLDSAHSCRARMSLMNGEIPFAPGVPSINTTSVGGAMFTWLEIPGLTQCRLLLAEGSETGLREAEKRLREYLRLSRTQHNTFQEITIMALLALALEKQGRTDDALAALETAVYLARPGGFIRPFVELGPPMAGLLKRLAEKNIAAAYIGRLLAAFHATPPPTASDAQPPDVQLTNRELDILDLLAQRLQTKEVAEKLFISSETVNTHLKNLYRKLGVHNRRDAVTSARNLGII